VRWLGHHSAAFTRSAYIDLRDDGIGEALAIRLPNGDQGAHKAQASATPLGTIQKEDPEEDSALEGGSAAPTPLGSGAWAAYDSAALTD
jgi:hypothetical protein